MLDFGDLLNLSDGIEVWRFFLCIIIAGIIYWGISTLYPEVESTFLAVVTFGPGIVAGIFWEYSSRKGRHYR